MVICTRSRMYSIVNYHLTVARRPTRWDTQPVVFCKQGVAAANPANAVVDNGTGRQREPEGGRPGRKDLSRWLGAAMILLWIRSSELGTDAARTCRTMLRRHWHTVQRKIIHSHEQLNPYFGTVKSGDRRAALHGLGKFTGACPRPGGSRTHRD